MPADTRRDLTERLREVLAFLRSRQAAHGYMPTRREIATALGITSTNGVNDLLVHLERKGWIERDPLKSRAIRVLDRYAPATAGGAR